MQIFYREKWAQYFRQHGILFVFWSAKSASASLEGKEVNLPFATESSEQESADSDTKVYGRDELLARLQSEAEEIVSMRTRSKSSNKASSNGHPTGVVVGFVGYPNVGKSSTINALVGGKKTGVTSTPGKTKHFQTLIISEKLTLCDCPGLVFPSFTSSRYEMIASGVLPIDRMTERREAVQVVADRVPRSVIEGVYRISLPKPKSYESQSRAPLAAELLRAYCASRGYVASSGLPDETKAARLILKDYIDGKLPHFQMPPGMAINEDELGSSEIHELSSDDDDDGDDDEDDDEASSVGEDGAGSTMEHALNDLSSFDIDNGLASTKVGTKVRKKSSTAPHKQHKKPQRQKDRSWRVRSDGSDGMPIVRVFQKPANVGPLKHP